MGSGLIFFLAIFLWIQILVSTMENITLSLTPARAALLLLALETYESEIGLGRNPDSLALASEIRAKLPPNPSPETDDLARDALRGEEYDKAEIRLALQLMLRRLTEFPTWSKEDDRDVLAFAHKKAQA